MEKLRHTVRESHKIKSSLTTSQPQIHSFCALSFHSASSLMWALKCGNLARDCPSTAIPPPPALLWPGASSIPGKSFLKTLGYQRPANPTPATQMGKSPASCTVCPRGRGCLGQNLPAESSKRREALGANGEWERASCESRISQVTPPLWLVHVTAHSISPAPLTPAPHAHIVQSTAIHIH